MSASYDTRSTYFPVVKNYRDHHPSNRVSRPSGIDEQSSSASNNKLTPRVTQESKRRDLQNQTRMMAFQGRVGHKGRSDKAEAGCIRLDPRRAVLPCWFCSPKDRSRNPA